MHTAAIGVAASTSSQYLLVYMPTYAIRELNLPQSIGFTAAVLAAALQTIAVPFVGIFVDKVGQTCVMIGAAILFMVTAYPAFVLLGAAPSLGVLIAMVCWISLLKSFFSGALPSLMAKTYFGADLRRVCAIFRPIADRSHRQQIGAELLHDRDCSFKPRGVAGDALEISFVGEPAAASG
jgi:MFS family permease